MARETHTPTPWTADEGYITGPSGEPIAVLGPASMFAASTLEREANGDLIVAAVNERAALRDALRSCIDALNSSSIQPRLAGHVLPSDAVGRARAALALGEEPKP